MDIVLLNPPPPEPNWCLEHLGLGYLSSILRKLNHHVFILDAGPKAMTPIDVYEKIKNENHFDLLGFTAMDPFTFNSGLEVVKLLKNDGLDFHTTVGGHLVSHWGDEILMRYPLLDSIILGEGEETIAELVQNLHLGKSLEGIEGLDFRYNQDIRINEARRAISNLNLIPFPERDYLLEAYQMYFAATIYSSRGCPRDCTFCSIPSFYRNNPGKNYRTRNAKNIVEEIEQVIKQYGVRFFLFIDDEFFGGNLQRKKVLIEFINLVREKELDFSFGIQYRADFGQDEQMLRELKNIGLIHAFIGMESGVDEILQRYDKAISKFQIQKAIRVAQDVGINLVGGYVLYDPYTSFAELTRNVEFLLFPNSPLVLNLHGMGIVKNTSQEIELRDTDLLIEEGLYQNYRIIDERVRKFVSLLHDYYPRIRPSILGIYKLLFLAGNFSKSDRDKYVREEIVLQKDLQKTHQDFLRSAIIECETLSDLGINRFDTKNERIGNLYTKIFTLIADWKKELGFDARMKNAYSRNK